MSECDYCRISKIRHVGLVPVSKCFFLRWWRKSLISLGFFGSIWSICHVVSRCLGLYWSITVSNPKHCYAAACLSWFFCFKARRKCPAFYPFASIALHAHGTGSSAPRWTEGFALRGEDYGGRGNFAAAMCYCFWSAVVMSVCCDTYDLFLDLCLIA